MITTQADGARPRPPGRHRARLPGPPDAAGPGGHAARTSTARSRSSASGSTRSASSEPEISRVGKDQIQVGLPNVSNAKRATDQIGTTAQLFLYDFEPNVIPPNPDVQDPAERARTTATDRRGPGRLEAARGLGRAVREAGLHDERRHLLPVRQEHARSRSASRPSARRTSTRTSPAGTTRADTRGGRRARGARSWSRTSPRTTRRPPTSTRPTTAVAVLRPPRPPGLTGDEITDPKPGTDQFNQPTVDLRLHRRRGARRSRTSPRRSPQRGSRTASRATGHAVRRDLVERGRPVLGLFAIVLDGELISRPIINFVDNPDGIDGRTGAQISGGHSPGGQGPRRGAARSARCRSSSR